MIVLIGPAPPPPHGVSLSIAQFMDWCRTRKISTRLIPSNVPWEHGARTKARLSHLWRLLGLVGHAIRLSFGNARQNPLCLTCATKDIALYRDVIIALTLRLFRRQFTVHVRGTEFSLCMGLKKFIVIAAYGDAHKIYASPQMADLHQFMNNDQCKVSIIPNGIEDYLTEDLDDKVRRFADRELNIIFLSNLYSFKGVRSFIDTIRQLNERGVAVKAKIAGAYTSQFDAKQLAEIIRSEGLSDIVECLGAVDKKGKKDLFAGSDILVFPSERESFGNVVVEAMSAGVLVVANATTSMDFILNDGAGFVLRDFDAGAAADLIVQIDPADFAARVRRARQSYVDRFTLDRYASDLVEALREGQCAR